MWKNIHYQISLKNLLCSYIVNSKNKSQANVLLISSYLFSTLVQSFYDAIYRSLITVLKRYDLTRTGLKFNSLFYYIPKCFVIQLFWACASNSSSTTSMIRLTQASNWLELVLLRKDRNSLVQFKYSQLAHSSEFYVDKGEKQ